MPTLHPNCRPHKNETKKQKKARLRHLDLNRERKRLFRLSNPSVARERDRQNMADWRKTRSAEWRAYSSAYFVEWLKDPINHRTHQIRSTTTAMKASIDRPCVGKNKERNLLIKSNLKKIGYQQMKSGEAINHIVSLRLFVLFDFDCSVSIMFDLMNLEICSREENNSVIKREVSPVVISTAKALEKKFPKELCGFSEFVAAKAGEII